MNSEGRILIYIVAAVLFLLACNKSETEIVKDIVPGTEDENALPIRSGRRPETTTSVPHMQMGIEFIPEVHEELIRRVYSIPGIVDRPSVISSWRGLWLSEDISVAQPEALIGGREYAHIHTDGSLHIFLEPDRAIEAEEKGWAIFHPFAVEGREGWEGFVMLYTPQSLEELDVTFQLIVDGYNFVTGQEIEATDYYD